MASSSTTSVQSIFDYINSLGELTPVLPAGGYSTRTCLTIATDVMLDIISERFNWKWNRMKIAPWYTISWQQDYAQIGLTNIGWLESGWWVDINNTALPKPEYRFECVRDLVPTSNSANPPSKVSWDYNSNLNAGVWPGAGQVYTNPVGQVITPTNPPTNIIDANGNILVLTTWGTTGETAPEAEADAPEGTQVPDGSVVWTVASPNSQGFRLVPLPPQQGIVYQMNVVAQMKAPAAFTKMSQFINPVPDDYAHWFRTGCIVYCYRMSPNPAANTTFDKKRLLWLDAMGGAAKQGDRELNSAGFVPDRGVVSPQGGWDVGPANPYLWNLWPGR